jgi:hypothetical protein
MCAFLDLKNEKALLRSQTTIEDLPFSTKFGR